MSQLHTSYTCKSLAVLSQFLHAESDCLQESAHDKSQATMAGTASTVNTPPLLSAMVHSQQGSQDQSYDSPVASFLMHSSSMTPLRSSQLESSSPSHPLFWHTSLQQQAVSLQQSPDKPSLHSSQQSPASLRHWQISAQQSPVRSWKSLKPESRATLDGSSELPGLQGKTGISTAPPAGNRLLRGLQEHGHSDSAGLERAAAGVHLGRAGSLEWPSQMAAVVGQLPVQGVQSGIHKKGCLGPTQAEPLPTASNHSSNSQPASKQEAAAIDRAPQSNHDSSFSGSMPPDAAFSTVDGSNCSPGRCSLGHASHAHEFVVEKGVEAGRGVPNSSMLAANVATGAQSSTVRLASAATSSFADCSSTLGRVSFPSMVGYQYAGESPAAMCCSSASNEFGLLSALNSADLAYLSGEPSRSMSAGKDVNDLCSSSSSSSRRGIKGSSNSMQAGSENTSSCAVADKSAVLVSCSNMQQLARLGSIPADSPNTMHGHGGLSMPAELSQVLGNDDGVLSGSDSEVLLLGEHSNRSVAAAYRTTGTPAHASYGCSGAGAKPDDNDNNDRVHSLEIGLNCGPSKALPAIYASCDSLYNDNDWEA